MQRRSYVALSSVVTGLVAGALAAGVASAVVEPRHALIIGGAFGLIGAVIGGLLGRHEHVKRWQKLRAVAGARRELGFEYRARVPRKELEPFRSLELFQSNSYTAATDWMQGVRDEESVLVFNFDPRASSQATRTVGQTVLLFPESAAGLPSFQLRPRERLRDFLGDDVSFDPTVVPEDEQRQAIERFTKSYVIQSADEAGVRRVFNATLLRILSNRPGWVVQCDGRHLLLFRPGKTELSARPALVDEAIGLGRVLLGGAVEMPATGRSSPILATPAVIPGKQRSPAYRTAQVVWRVLAGLASAAFVGAMSGLQLGGARNPVIAARNGALVGVAIVIGVTVLGFLVLVVRALLKPSSSTPDPEQSEYP